MAAANIVRSAFGGLLRKSTSYRTPVVCRLSTVVAVQKLRTVQTIAKINYQVQNGVRVLSINTIIIFILLNFYPSLCLRYDI